MRREPHARFCESLGVRFPGATLPDSNDVRHIKFVRLRSDKASREVTKGVVRDTLIPPGRIEGA